MFLPISIGGVNLIFFFFNAPHFHCGGAGPKFPRWGSTLISTGGALISTGGGLTIRKLNPTTQKLAATYPNRSSRVSKVVVKLSFVYMSSKVVLSPHKASPCLIRSLWLSVPDGFMCLSSHSCYASSAWLFIYYKDSAISEFRAGLVVTNRLKRNQRNDDTRKRQHEILHRNYCIFGFVAFGLLWSIRILDGRNRYRFCVLRFWRWRV